MTYDSRHHFHMNQRVYLGREIAGPPAAVGTRFDRDLLIYVLDQLEEALPRLGYEIVVTERDTEYSRGTPANDYAVRTFRIWLPTENEWLYATFSVWGCSCESGAWEAMKALSENIAGLN